MTIDHATEDRDALDAAALRRNVLDLINSSWKTQTIGTAAELRIADRLSSAPRGVESLAQAAGCHAPSLRRLLRALASLGLVAQHEGDAFTLTSAGALLRADAGDSLAAWARMCSGEAWRNWSRLADSVRTGASARRVARGTDGFEHLDDDLDAAALFHTAMMNLTRPIATDIARRVEFTGSECVVDVGGGYGEVLATLLVVYPAMRGVLFDLEHAIAAAAAELARRDVAGRCELVAGSFFDRVPAAADLYLLKSVLHDWDDEHCATILQQCRNAMAAHAQGSARLLVIERLAPEKFKASARDRSIARSDLNMLVSLSGRERTEREYRALLGVAGLQATRITALVGDFSAVEAIAMT